MRKGQRVILHNKKMNLLLEGRVYDLTDTGQVASIETPTGEIVQVLNTSFKILTLLQALVQLLINFFKK